MIRNLVPTSVKTQHASISKTKWMMLFLEAIVSYSDNHIKLINTLCGQTSEILNFVPGGI
jgi:hypothetical protein